MREDGKKIIIFHKRPMVEVTGIGKGLLHQCF